METQSLRQSKASADKSFTTDISTFVLSNSLGTTMVLSELGAAVTSLLVADRSGKIEDIVLGYDSPHHYLSDEYYMGTVVGRYANRIAGNTVIIDDEIYKLSTAHDGFVQHGGIEGFNKKIFKGSPFTNASGTGVSFTYTSPDMDQGFPGEFTLKVTYTLDEFNAWTIEYEGRSTQNTIVNLTQHTYFNLSGNPANPIDEHEFRINTNLYLPVNPQQVPTGEIAEVESTPFDFKEFRKLNIHAAENHDQLLISQGYDHSFVLEKAHTNELKPAVSVREPKSGRQIDAYTTEPSVHLYTGNYLGNVVGKNNIVYGKRSGFCLETQHFPDAPNQPHFPSTELKAGDLFYSKTIYKFSIFPDNA